MSLYVSILTFKNNTSIWKLRHSIWSTKYSKIVVRLI